MKLQELYEGVAPKLPGAAGGVQIMTPQQFVATNAGDEEPSSKQDDNEDMTEGSMAEVGYSDQLGKLNVQDSVILASAKQVGTISQKPVMKYEQGNTTLFFFTEDDKISALVLLSDHNKLRAIKNFTGQSGQIYALINYIVNIANTKLIITPDEPLTKEGFQWVAKLIKNPAGLKILDLNGEPANIDSLRTEWLKSKSTQGTETGNTGIIISESSRQWKMKLKENEARLMPHIYFNVSTTNKQGIAEATKLPASTRELKGQELQDYLDRIREKEKKKTDKYKLPYIHRSSVLGYYNEEGKKYDTDAIKDALRQRPKKLLKQNEKMKHSNGELEQFFNIGFAALTGVALDEQTNEIIIVNTCPGAGSCKIDCFAMKGGKIQFAGPWLSDGRILSFLLNDPDGFFSKLDAEIKKEEKLGDKGGYTVTIRWHDAGDFFSPEYTDLAFKLAKANPHVLFYAYTKIANVVLADKPANFIINWSEGAHPSQEKQIKAGDPSLDQTKNSRIIPSSMFYDLLVKDEKKNLVKGPDGQWQVIPDKLPELKQRLAKAYNISPNSILSYSEWDTKGKRIPNMKWNDIITPGEPDITARDPGVLSTLLLKH